MTIFKKLDIAKQLQEHHYFFRAFWDIGDINIGQFSDCPSAQVSFDETGESTNLIINEDFWNSLNEQSQLFLICHEMLHIVLRHGKRFVDSLGTPDSIAMNNAADVVINEMLCRSFGFVREELVERLKTEGCWYDTVFPNQNILHDQSTEFYFNKLREQEKTPEGLFSIDQHGVCTQEQLEKMEKILVDAGIMDAIDQGFISAISDKDLGAGMLAGDGTGSWQSVSIKKKIKQKWETVIKKWEKFHAKEDINITDRWERVNPRYSHILTDKIHLPTESRVFDVSKVESKIDVFFYLDTSGSCIHLKDRFFSAAASLDPNRFNMRLFCFDTTVNETTLKSGRIYGGGGTLFHIIESSIQSVMRTDHIHYPKAVFLITDGFGNPVNPQYPDRWYWFLSHNYTSYIPPKSKIFKLSDYE